jgi:hypothetical protein
MVTERERRKDRMDMASLVLAAAGLGLSVVALLNEKGEVVMANKIDSSKYSKRRDLKKAYAQEIKRTAVSEIGYTGTVIVLNEKGEQVQYGLVPLENRKIVSEKMRNCICYVESCFATHTLTSFRNIVVITSSRCA